MKIVGPKDSLTEVIEFDKIRPKIISFVGAGGKTTLMHRLGKELTERNITALISTTTKMYRPGEQYYEWRGEERADEIQEVLQRGELVVTGRTIPGAGEAVKITGIPEEDYGRLCELAEVLLIEADGSRGKPLKVPAEHEPVLFPGTELVVGVLGMKSNGMRISDAAQRPEDVAEFLRTDVEHRITPEDLEAIARSPRGLKKGVSCHYVAVGNDYGASVL